MATIRVHNKVQQVLFECELRGQISDGLWENSAPRDHWKIPCSADVIVDPLNPGLDWFPNRKYDFANKKLVEYVGDRMLMYARIALMYPNLSHQAIKAVNNGEWFWNSPFYLVAFIDELGSIGLRTYTDKLNFIKRIESARYQLKDLKRDLREVSQLFARKNDD